MLDENLKVLSLPRGSIKFAMPVDIWRQEFPIPFNAMNAIVSKHFSQLTLRDVHHRTIESTPGFMRYMVSYKEIGDLGEIYIQKLPNGNTQLSIPNPIDDDAPIGWTQEQQNLIQSQPDRESEIKMRYELARSEAAKREEMQKCQELIFVVFLKNLLGDPHIVQVQKTFFDHFNDFARYVQAEVRMGFWQQDKEQKQKRKWISRPEQRAKDLLRVFLNGRFGDSIYEFEEIRSGAGFIDVLIIAPSRKKVIVELKMCGNGYSSGYAQGGLEQLLHYMQNKGANTGFLMVFDSRLGDFAKGFQKGEQIIDRKSIFTIIVDVRPKFKRKDAQTPA